MKATKLYVIEDQVGGEWSSFYHNARWTRTAIRKLKHELSGRGLKVRIAVYQRKGVVR